MERETSGERADANPGLIAGIAGLVKNMFGLAVSRIELAAFELGEIRGKFAKLAMMAALGVIAIWFAVACWTALVVVIAWETWGWKILLLLAVLFTLAGIGILAYARSLLRGDRLSMPHTLAELRKDRDAFL
jgi:uncharacterized membrane protein YqjE